MNPGWRGFAAYPGLPILNRSAVNTTDRRFIEKRNFKERKRGGFEKSARFAFSLAYASGYGYVAFVLTSQH